MKNISAELQAHLEQEVTTMCTCWKLIREDGLIQGFTNHVVDFEYGGVLYEASTGFTPSNIESTDDLSVGNMDIIGLLDSNSISRDAILAGEYDNAEVYIFMVNYEDLTMGDIKLQCGTIGEIKTGRVTFEAEFRSLAQKLDQTIGEVYSVTCRADLGDSRCGILISADTWEPRLYVESGDYLKATLGNRTNRKFKVTTGGYTASQEPSWNTTLLGSTSETGIEIVTDGAFNNALSIHWNGDIEWSITGGVASCDGTQVANSSLTQDSSLVTAPISSTPYSTSFDVSNITAGNVRIVVGGVAGTWRSTNGTFNEDINAGSSGNVVIEADSDFIGDIDNVSVIEKADVVYETDESYLQIGSVTSVISNEKFTDSSRTEADNYFNGGYLTFVDGANAGKSMEIKTYISKEFQFVLPFPYNILPSDKYEVYRGCDKVYDSDCKLVFDNVINFRGEPFIPGIDEVTKFGGQ